MLSMLPIVVPPEDDTIQTALAELDERLSAWVEAVGGVDADLRERLEFCESTEAALAEAKAAFEEAAESTSCNEEIAPSAESAESSFEDSVVSEPAEDVSDVVTESDAFAPSVDAVDEAADDTTLLEEEPVVPTPSPVKPAAPKQVSKAMAAKFATNKPVAPLAEPVPAPQVVEPPPQAAVVDEDEALLATLDEKTAKAIRMMRRLSPVKKSVKELLAEYQPDQSAKPEAAAPARGSWWKRKSS